MRALPRVGDGGGTGPGFGIRPVWPLVGWVWIGASGIAAVSPHGRAATVRLKAPRLQRNSRKLDSGRLDHFETLPAYWLS